MSGYFRSSRQKARRWPMNWKEAGMETRYCTECCSLCVPYGKTSDGGQVLYRCTNPECGARDTELREKSSPWDIHHAWRCKVCGALHMTTHQEYLGYKRPCRLCGTYYDPERRPEPGKFGIDHSARKQPTAGSQAGVPTRQTRSRGGRSRKSAGWGGHQPAW